MIAFFGLASRDVRTTLTIAAIYAVCCFLIGMMWFKSDFFKAQTEVFNRYNIFVSQMRKKFGEPKIAKFK